ncbi:MAG: type II toxin-antitoxin system VapC family toxin [Stellaceae bacterium]
MNDRYLLDTNIVSDLIRNPGGRVAAWIEKVGQQSVFTSIIVAAEIRYGIVKSRSTRLASQLLPIFETLEILPFEAPADMHYGELRASLERTGNLIDPNDLLIASQAIALGLAVVTDNEREFLRVPGLKVENWLRPLPN